MALVYFAISRFNSSHKRNLFQSEVTWGYHSRGTRMFNDRRFWPLTKPRAIYTQNESSWQLTCKWNPFCNCCHSGSLQTPPLDSGAGALRLRWCLFLILWPCWRQLFLSPVGWALLYLALLRAGVSSMLLGRTLMPSHPASRNATSSSSTFMVCGVIVYARELSRSLVVDAGPTTTLTATRKPQVPFMEHGAGG